MSISLDLFPAGGGSGGLFLRNSVLLILDVVSYHFPSYFNRKNQSLFFNISLLPTGSLRGDRFFFILHATENYSLQTHSSSRSTHTHTQSRIEQQQIFSGAVEYSPIFKLIPKNRYHDISCTLTRRSVSQQWHTLGEPCASMAGSDNR